MLRTLRVASILSPCLYTNLAVFSIAWCCFLLFGRATLVTPTCDASCRISAGVATSSCHGMHA